MTNTNSIKNPVVKSFGTFKGVFTPSLITILGAILFLRMGWLVGHTGIITTLLIITFASALTFITGLSVASTATNMNVKGGGVYYIVSRSLGIETGASVGLPLYLAQACGIAFYITGFSEALSGSFTSYVVIPELYISITILCLLTLVSYKSTDFALKIQLLLLGVIIIALVSIFTGDPSQLNLALDSKEAFGTIPKVTFWQAFAVFFPAVTGIEAGLSMSGVLKNPSRSLPLGTIGAVVTGFMVYGCLALFLHYFVPQSYLKSQPLVLYHIAQVGFFVLLGIWGATLSSALGGLLGAPRTLQALAKDRIIPSFLVSRKSEGPSLLITFGIALSLFLSYRPKTYS